MKTVTTRTSTYILRDDGIIVQEVRGKQQLLDAQENMKVFLELAGGTKRLLLCDLRESGPTGPGVRQFYATHTNHLNAVALVISSPLSEMIGNFFVRLNKPDVPTAFFADQETAIPWLLQVGTKSK